jgi:G3E family GTPase
MFSFEDDASASRIPVTVVFGPRDGGKSAWIARVAEGSLDRPVAVISNEGPLPSGAFDGERVDGPLVPHAVGCLCCVARSGLVDALRRLHVRGTRVHARPPARVVVETVEGADPAPVLQTLLNNALVTHYFRLDDVVVVLDGRMSADSADTAPGLAKQVALADRIVLAGEDAFETAGTAALAARLRALNPQAVAITASDEPRVAGEGSSALEEFRATQRLDRWLAADLPADHGDVSGLYRFRLALDAPVAWEGLHGWIHAGLQLHGDVIYRVRGVLRLSDEPAPVILHGVQHVMQPPYRLRGWGRMPRRTVLQFVTRELPGSVVAESFARDLPAFVRSAADREDRRRRALADPSLPA